MIEIPFDQYQRYKNTQLIIESIRKVGEKFNILEVGANSHRNLEKFLPEDKVTYLDITLPEELLNDPQYILGDATDMQFSDNSYDIVIALDVYEHIPKSIRENFIKEIYRVCKNNVIISAPFNKDEVVLAEDRANNFFKTISGIDHIWLIEHIQNGLPSIDGLLKYLTINNINYTHFSHGNLERWEKLTNMHLSSVVFGSMIEYKNKVDNYYNSFVFENDYDKMGYRDFFVFNKSREYIHNDKSKSDIKDQINELEKNFYYLLQMIEYRQIENHEHQTTLVDNTVKIYIDYGSGFNESDILTDVIEFNVENTIKFDINQREINTFRIDPTESSGKYILKDVIIIDQSGQKIEDINIDSNSSFCRENISYFINSDPQFMVQFNKSRISSIQFTIKKIDVNTSFSSVSDEIINELNNSIISKNEQIKDLSKINTRLVEKENELNNKVMVLEEELDKKLSVKLNKLIKRVFK